MQKSKINNNRRNTVKLFFHRYAHDLPIKPNPYYGKIFHLVNKEKICNREEVKKRVGKSEESKSEFAIDDLMGLFQAKKFNILAMLLWCQEAPWPILPDRPDLSPAPLDLAIKAWAWLKGFGVTPEEADLLIGRLFLLDDGEIIEWLGLSRHAFYYKLRPNLLDKVRLGLPDTPDHKRIDCMERVALALFEHLGMAVPEDAPYSDELLQSLLGKISKRPKPPKREGGRKRGRKGGGASGAMENGSPG